MSESGVGDRFRDEMSTRALEMSNDAESIKDLHSGDSLA